MKEASDADTGANGTTGLAGSLNVKESYRANGYPDVKLIEAGGCGCAALA